MRVIEKPIILPRVSGTLIPTTAAIPQPMMSNPTRATTMWPSTVPASANLFLTRNWPIPPSKESNTALAKQKMVESDLSKSESDPVRKTAISHPLPSVQNVSTAATNPATTNITAVPNIQSPGRKCKALCLICAKSATCPSQEDSDWLEKDWEGEMRKRQRKGRLEKTSGYYPPELIIHPSPEREVPILVRDLITAPVLREIKSISQTGKEGEERIENRRIVDYTFL